MTLIATLHPYYYPIVLSDLLVTSGQHEISVTTDQKGVAIEIGKEFFCRKVITFDEGPSAYGFAGEAEAILDFVDGLRFRFPHRDLDVPPARFVGELVREFNANFGRNAISCVGFTAGNFEVGRGISVLRGIDRRTQQTRSFNEIYATGSGTDQFFKLVSDYDSQLAEDAHPIELRIIQLIGAINATLLYSKGDEFAAHGWGGYVESIVIQDYKALYREPQWHYIAYEIDESDNIEQLATQYHYCATPQCQGLLKIEEKEDVISYSLFPILSLLDEQPMRTIKLVEPPDWKIIPITVALFFKNKNRMAFYTMMPNELDAIVRFDAWCLGLSDDYCREIARDLSAKVRSKLGL